MRSNNGFSLIELMVVVAIIGLLASIALPSYADYVTRAQITQAVSGLSGMRVKMEQYFQDNRTYASGGACGAALPTASLFTFTCVADATTYTVTATGSGTMSSFAYTVNQANTKGTTSVPSGWTSSTTCWVTKKDGSC